MLVQRFKKTNLLYIPEANRLIFTATGKRMPIRAKGNGPDVVGMRLEYLETIAALDIPKTNSSIVATTGQEVTARMVYDRPDIMAVAGHDCCTGT